MNHLGRWIACGVLIAACGGGKATPKQPDPGPTIDAGVVAEDPEGPADAAEAFLDVTGIQPTTGDAGTEVVIYGSAFTKESRDIEVWFGAKKAEVTDVRDTQMTVIAPKASKGDVVDISITFSPGGKIQLPDAFSYPEED